MTEVTKLQGYYEPNQYQYSSDRLTIVEVGYRVTRG